MAMQMYLVHPTHNESDGDRESIAEFVAQRHGFILMATSYGSLIVAIDDAYFDGVKAHPMVAFASGVTLNLSAPGAAALKQIFAENVALQLNERRAPGIRPGAPDSFFPGYRPLRWPSREQEGGD